MKLLPALVSTTLLFIPAIQSAAQFPNLWNVSGAPFTATWTATRVDDKSGSIEAGTRTFTIQGARDKNGSSYWAWMKDGHTTEIQIIDVLKNRKIVIHPQDSTYFYMFTVLDTEGKVRTFSMEESFKQLQNMQYPDQSDAMKRSHVTVLGCRQEDGLNLCGVRQEDTWNSGVKDTYNSWWSDLGILMRFTARRENLTPTERGIQAFTDSVVVSDLRRVEPDPKLFEIPEGYTEIPTPPQYPPPQTSVQQHPSPTSRQ